MGIALGVGAGAAVGVVAVAGPGVQPATVPGGGDKYQPGPGDRGLRGPGDLIMEHAPREWHSHLLPFARPFADKASLVGELQRARAQRLLG